MTRVWKPVPIQFQDTLFRMDLIIRNNTDPSLDGMFVYHFGEVKVVIRPIYHHLHYIAGRSQWHPQRISFPDWQVRWEWTDSPTKHRSSVRYLARSESLMIRDLTMVKLSAEFE
jgi:hypothetical protein